MSYTPNEPISEKLKVVHATADVKPAKPSGLKSAGGNVGGKHPSILSFDKANAETN